MAISGAASKVAKKFQNSKINQKLTKKLDDVTSSLKSKTKNITTNIAKKTKEATQKAVNTVSDKAKTIANKTLVGTNTVKNAINNVPKSAKNKVASVIDSLGEGILNVQNAFAPTYEFAEIGPIKAIKTGFGESGEETLSQFLSKDVKQLKTMFFNQSNNFQINQNNNIIKEYDILEYGKFNRPETSGDGLTGHELLQNAWLVANEKATRGKGLSRKNPAIALKEDPMHKRISAKQRTKKMNTKNLKNVSWRSNVKENIKILIEENVPRDKIAELAWKTRKFAIENKF